MIKKILLLIYGLFSLFWLQAQSPGGVSTNLAAWYKADAGVTTGATMTWADQGPNGVNVTQGTAANQPVYNTTSNLINFNRCLTFDGTNDRLTNATGGAATANSAFTVYYVAVNNATTTTRYAIGLGASTGANGFYSGTTGAVTTKSSGSNTLVTQASAWQSGLPGVTRSGFNGGASAPFYQASNSGTEVTSANLALNITNTNLCIGARPDGTANFWQGNIAEVIYYTGKHAAANYNRVESYLALKYGITKAGNYINSASTTVWTSGGGYDNNIAGIGRDDMGGTANSGLNQKQSQSQNTGNQVILGIGDIVTTTNAAHTGSFPSAQHLVWGDNNTAGTTTFSSAPYTNRLQRVWRVQNTGSVNQDIRVLIPVALLGQNQSGALLYSTSSTFASGNQLYMNKGIGSVGGTSYYVFTIPAAQANQAVFYFTVAYYQQSPGGVSGANLWLRADVGTSTTTDAATLSTWTDQSGQRTNLATTSSGLQTFKNNAADNINFNPAVYFDGLGGLNFGNDYIFTPSGNGGVTLFAAAAPDNTAATKSAQFLYDFGFTQNEDYRLIYSSTNSAIGTPIDFGGVETVTTQSNGIIPSIIGGQINFGSNQFLFNNGLQYGTTAITLAALTATQIAEAASHNATGGPVSIGRQAKSAAFTNDNTRAYQGHLGEIIHFSDNLTAIERQRVNSYLAMKYGITLTRDNDNDSTPGETLSGSVLEGDYVASDGTTRVWNSDAAYQNNIGAIGRDDTSGLIQKQSQSMNDGYQLALSLGTIFVTNQNNNGDFPVDRQFFMWGDNAGSLDAITATGNPSYAYRFARLWKTQNTNTFNQAVRLYFPVAAFKNAPASSVYLLYGTTAAALGNGTATAILQSGTTSINGVSNYVFSVSAAQLTNMQFFSFAANITYPGGVASGLKIWHKADAGVTAASNLVTAWTNQADGRQVTNSGGTQRPTLVSSGSLFNFNPYLDFTAATNALYDTGATPFAADGDISYFVALKPATTTGNEGQIFAINNPSATAGSIYDSHEWFNNMVYNFNSGALTYSTSMVGLDQSVATYIHNGAANVLNGYRNLNVIINNASITGALGSGGYVFGADSGIATGNNNSSIAQFSEHIAYDRVLSGAEIQRVQTYLTIKTGVTLNQNHLLSDGTTNVWNTATNSGYNNNIAGIGRDDLSALYQKQSQSVNTGSQVVMALGTVAASNSANANTIATDKQFFIWGDDNGSLTTQVLTGNNTYTYRFTRVWKTQNTGSFAQNMTVYYPVSAFGNALPATVALLYGTTAASLSNGTASAIAQSGTTTINGASYYTFTVPSAQVANMQFFSFAANITYPGGVMGSSLWLKADLGTSTTTDGVAMSQWNDQSGNVNNVSQGTAANRPLYRSNSANQMNFNPTVSFDGTNDFMDATTFTINSTGNTLFSAVKPNIVTGTRNVLGYGTVGTFVGGELRLNNATLEYNQNNPTFTPVTSGSVAIANAPLLFGSSMSNGSSGASVYQNNRAIATGAIDQFPSAANLVSIGSRTIESRDFYFNGLIPEVIAYNTLITAAERQRVNSYLAIKYGMTLDQSTVLNFNNGDFNTGDFNYWLVSGNVDASGNAARFNAADTTPNAVISQSINTINGQSYTVGGDVRRIGAGAGTPRVRLDVIDNTTSVVIATQNITAASGTATPFTPLVFTGNGNSFTIRFTDTSTATASLDIVLDNVTLTPNASTAGTNYLNSVNGIIWDATINAAYNKNIAGIGRDDLSALYQKQSQSVNSGSQVVMSLGTVAASNLANANTIAADKQFFIWGDDNGSLTTQVLTGNTTYTYRFTRIWKTQNTASFAENMTVYYPVSAFGNALPATVALLYGTTAASLSNGTASATAQSGTTTINGASYYAFTVPSAQVANMQFFSFAGTQTAPGGVSNGLTLWLDAQRESVGIKTSLNNYAGNTINITKQGSGSARVVAGRANFNNQISMSDAGNVFVDNSYFESSASILANGENTFAEFYVFGKPDFQSGADFDEVVIYDASNASSHRIENNNSLNTYGFYDNNYSGNLGFSQSPISPESFMMSTAHSGTQYRGFTNGFQANTLSTTTGINAGGAWRIGNDVFNDASGNWNATNFNEVVVYSEALSNPELLRVHSYFALKYGITLDQSSPNNYIASDGITILWNASTNTGYNNNIAGIGRDDISALTQKQSKSINTGSQVVMALGTAAASNLANANTIPTDKQFFIWGDDNGSLTTQVLTGNNTYTYRFTRVWKTQNTGSFSQNITVYYPVSAFGNALPSTIALLYGTTAASLSNGTASAIAQSSTTTINGASYYAFTIPSAQVANMQFFSFAGTQTAPGGVAGVNLWLKADAGTSTTTNGATLNTWADQSGQRTNLATTSSGLQTFKNNTADNINFNPAVYFDGLGGLNFGNDYIFTPAGNGGVTLFAANRPDNTAAAKSEQFIFDFGSHAGENYALLYSNNTSKIISASSFGGAFTSSPVTNGVIPTVIGGQINFGSNQYLFNNGLQYSTATITLPALTATEIEEASTHGGAGAGAGGPVSIGRQSKSVAFTSNDTRAYQGHLGEIIHYSANLTAIQRLRVNTYLALKYGTTLTRDNNGNATGGEVISGSVIEGDYVASDGTTRLWNSDGVYLNNIAGIGRDDLSALYQKQSQSVNSGSQVVMSLGTAAASNQANAGTIPTDKQFFIWGDDNGSLSTFVSTGNITYPSRFTRIWKTQNTGTFAENMTVYYPVSAFGTSLAAYVGIIYGSSAASLSNGSASVIPQSGTTTINGVSYYVFTVPSAQVGDMQFFSFTGNSICYKPAVTVGTTLDTKHGITALNRAGAAGDNWPMVRKGAWTVLEAKTKGFVINRLTAAQIAAIPPANLVEGMMIYDTTNNCMKVYTSTDGGTTFGWQCITTQTCPD